MYAERTEKTASEKDKTGIPRKMKTGFEHSSGFSFDDVRVHYNSEKPAQLRAHAYTQGNEVYVAPGQEKHLPHELGHVVQQKSDMVKPTDEIGGLPLNDDAVMENGADMIAENAENAEDFGGAPVQAKFKGDGIVQRAGVDTQESYNAWAGFGSTFVGMLGIAGGIGSFLYTKHNERKHRYIEEIEKYADAACDAREEQIAAKVQFNTSDEDKDRNNALADALKQKAKIKRNRDAALQKSAAMGKKSLKNQNVIDALDRAEGAYHRSEKDFGVNKLREILPNDWQNYVEEQDAGTHTGQQAVVSHDRETQTEEESTIGDIQAIVQQDTESEGEDESKTNYGHDEELEDIRENEHEPSSGSF